MLRAMRRLKSSGGPMAESNGTDVTASAPPSPAAKTGGRVAQQIDIGIAKRSARAC